MSDLTPSHKRTIFLSVLLIVSLVNVLSVSSVPVAAQVPEIEWTAPENISRSPDKTSTDAFLLADPAGFVHLFWGEKVTDNPGEQSDTLMYSRWDGREWIKPIDIFFAPLADVNLVVAYPQAVIDDNGRIHLIWLGQPNAPAYTLYYSSVDASRAGSANAWDPRSTLAEGLTGTKYSMDIAYTGSQTLHIIYARVPSGDDIREERAVTYIRTTDDGNNWSEPLDIYTVPYLSWGASDTRLLVDPPDKLHATWTLWDKSGNGQEVDFASSLDNGLTWGPPVVLDTRVDPEYERDWNSIAMIGPDRIVSIMEGGYRAYRLALYSNDGGQTWTKPVDVFPYLIGDNGRVEFAKDSTGRLHVFVAQRIREGNELRGDRIGLWHSYLIDGETRWTDPILVTKDPETAKNITNPKVVIANGNQVVAAWYGSGVNEIFVQTGVINDAPYLTPSPWKVTNAPVAPTQAMSVLTEQSGIARTPIALSNQFDSNTGSVTNNGFIILLGIIPALVVVLSFVSIQYARLRNK